MSSLIPRTASSLATGQAPDGFSRTEAKALSRQQNAEVTRGLVAGTRVQAAGFVAGIGLQTTAMLSREARFQADGDPQTTERLDHIADAYAMYVGAEVSRFRY